MGVFNGDVFFINPSHGLIKLMDVGGDLRKIIDNHKALVNKSRKDR